MALACGLAGCVALPKPDVDVTLPTDWRNTHPSPAPASPDLRGWWQVFADARLNSVIDQALAANLDVQGAVARLAAARTLHRHVDAAFRPELHARSFDAIDPDASASFFVAGFDATWELGWFGRSAGARRVAQGDMDRAAADVRDARLSLVAEVVRNWIDLRAAQQREELLTHICDGRQRQADLVGVRVSLALASRQQLAQAQATSAESQVALAASKQDIVAASQSLAALLGRAEPDPAWLQSAPLPQLGDWQLQDAPADLLRTRPDIARSEADVLRVSGELGLARADLYPSIGLGGSLHWSTNITSNRHTQADEAIGALGPAIDIPLFDWGMRRSRVTAKTDELSAAALAYRQTVLNAVSEAETALGAVEQQRQSELNNLHAWQSLADSADKMSERRRLGLASDIERMASEIERDQAALALADARSAHDLAYVALYKALGGAPDPGAGNNDAHTPETR
jgi:NodT family efflux transporter outer membrane factor (OMF) lipoprotein